MKNYLDKIALFILSCALFFLLLEVIASVLLPVLKLNQGHVKLGVAGKYILEYPHGYIKDRELFWRMEPLCGDRDSSGFRNEETRFSKNKDTFRVACVGDSVTFGFPVEIGLTYPKVLGRLLQGRIPDKKVEALNFGVPGYTSFQGVVLLQKEVLRYDPDLIIAYYGVNDREAAYKQDKEQKKLPQWAVNAENYLKRFALYRLFAKTILGLKHSYAKDKPSIINRVSPEDYQKNLREIAALAGQKGARCLFVVNPAYYDPEAKTVLCDAKYLPPPGLPQLDIYALFKKRGKGSGRFFLDDVRPVNFHLTQEGQAVLAQGVFEELARNGLLAGRGEETNKERKKGSS